MACGKAGALVALVFFVLVPDVTFAHYDGDVSQPQHRYRFSSSTAWRDDIVEACQDETTTGTYNRTQFNITTKQWVCVLSLSAGGESSWQVNEAHCDQWAQDAPDCTSSSRSCASVANQQVTWNSNRLPWGFNVPDESGLPSPWDTYQGCSMRLVGFTANNNCTRVTYEATGAEHIDEEGRPLASNTGDPYQNGVPANCDPDTGATTGNGPQTSTNTCIQRAGERTVLSFDFDNVMYPDPPPAPAWMCVRTCKAITDGNPAFGVGLTPDTAWIGYSGADTTTAVAEVQYMFPFEDHEDYGQCTAGTAATSTLTPHGTTGEVPGSGTSGSGNSSGGGTDVSGVEDRLDGLTDALTECDVSRGDICAAGDTTAEEARGQPGHTALDGVASDGMGQAEAAALDDNAPVWSSPLTGWANGAGSTACTALDGQLLGVSFSVDLCEWAELSRGVLFWVFNVIGVAYLFGVWQRAAEV
jgi:hypothetical protein